MQQASRKAESTLRRSDLHNQDTASIIYNDTYNIIDTNGNFFDDAVHNSHRLDALHGYDEDLGQQRGDPNDFDQSDIAIMGLGGQGILSPSSRSSSNTPSFSPQNAGDVLGTIENHVAAAGPNARDYEWRDNVAQIPQQAPYHMSHRSTSNVSSRFSPMHSSPYASTGRGNALPDVAGHSKYTLFQGCFSSSMTAKNFRHTSTRFGREPYKPPHEDLTIAEVDTDREQHVHRIYNAMIRGDVAKDNKNSTAMKRWVHTANYPSLMVIAYAHKVFDALLEQVRQGFRGWPQDDYVVDERKGDDEDRYTDCAGRLNNIITALEQEKSVCEDVMKSANQIRMLVNAPKAYAKRKEQNRVGNSKRPSAKAQTDGKNSRPLKKRRTERGRGQSRALSGAPEMLSSQGTTPHRPPETTPLPYYRNPYLQHVADSSSTPTCFARLAPTMHRPIHHQHRSSIGEHQSSTLSPTALSNRSSIRTPQITSVPPIAGSPFMLPPPLSHSLSPPFAPPHNLKAADSHLRTRSWHKANCSEESPTTVFHRTNLPSQSGFDDAKDWTQFDSPSNIYNGIGLANLFEKHSEVGVALADLEDMSSGHVATAVPSDDFAAFWAQQIDVQDLLFTKL